MQISTRILTSLSTLAIAIGLCSAPKIPGANKFFKVYKSLQTAMLGSNYSVQANYFISPLGSDTTGNGQLNNPYKTLNKVRQIVSADPNQGVKPIVVMIRGNTGTYYNTNVTFTSSDSGTLAGPITYEAYPGETPVFSGGIRITGWQTSTAGNCSGLSLPAGSSCWKATLPAGTTFFEKLWYNGVPRLRPRMGATSTQLEGTYGISTGQVSGVSSGCPSNANDNVICGFTYTTTDPVSNWTSCNTYRCYVWNFSKWDAPVSVISSISTGTHTILFNCTSSSNCNDQNAGTGGPGLANERYVIDNVLELFKKPGQWFLDSNVSPMVAYYISNNGENPNADVVEVGQSNQVITASNLSNVTFAGIRFQNDGWDIPSTGFISTQLDPSLTNALFSCDSCTNINLINNILANTTSIGFRLTGNSNNILLSGNAIFDIGAYGIQIGIHASNTTCSGGCTDSNTPRNVTITNNWIDYTGRFLPSGDGIMLGIANNVTITFNDIGWAYDKGLEICMPSQHTCRAGSATTDNIDIEGNDVHDIIQGVMTDAAGFYASTETATNNVFKGNRIHDVNGAVVQNPNELDAGTHCMYVDDFTGLWTIQNNLVYRCSDAGMNFNDGPSSANQQNVVKNNIIVNTAGLTGGSGAGSGASIQIRCPQNAVGCAPSSPVLAFIFQNNIVYQDTTGHATINPETGPAANSTAIQSFVSNIYSLAGTAKFNVKGVGNTLSFGTWQSNGQDAAGLNTTNSGVHFTAPGHCSNSSTIPVPGTCDDFTFTDAGPGHGFVVFPQIFGPTTVLQIPVMPPTFPEATLSLALY